MDIKKMSLFTTGKCNLHCKNCIMGKIKDTSPDYEISLEELRELIDITKASGYKFHFTISGGEPLLWSHLQEGVKMLSDSGVCTGMRMFTNAIDLKRLNDDTAQCINQIRISRYYGNSKNCDILKEKYGNRVRIVERQQFYDIHTPVPSAVPAECEYHKWWYYDRNIYCCAHGPSLYPESPYKLCNPLKIGYAEGLAEIKKKLMNDPCGACTKCSTNSKFKQEAKQISNTPPFIKYQ